MPVIPRAQVELVEEFSDEPTRGVFGTATLAWDAAPGEHNKDRVIEFPIAVLEAQITTKGLNDGDKIGCDVNPGTPVGQLPEASGQGVKVHVMPATMEAAWEAGQIQFGDRIGFSDGAEAHECLGCLNAVDLDANTFTTLKGSATGWPAGSLIMLTPTLTPGAFEDDGCGWVELKGDTGTHYVGRSKVGGSYIPAGSTMRWRYVNVGQEAVRVVIRLEFLR